MPLNTYSELQTALALHLNRAGDSTITTALPDLIALFETAVVTDPRFRVREMEQRSTATLSTQYTPLPSAPDGFVEMRLIKLNTTPVRTLDYVSPDEFWRLEGAGVSGQPRVFTIIGSELAVSPSPDTNYTAEMWFYQFDALSVSNPTNWLLTKYPAIYLFGTLCEAEPFLANDARMVLWKSKLEELVDNLGKSDWRARWSAGPLVVRPASATP